MRKNVGVSGGEKTP